MAIPFLVKHSSLPSGWKAVLTGVLQHINQEVFLWIFSPQPLLPIHIHRIRFDALGQSGLSTRMISRLLKKKVSGKDFACGFKEESRIFSCLTCEVDVQIVSTLFGW